MEDFMKYVGTPVLILLGIFFLIICGLVSWIKSVDGTACTNFSLQSGYETKFVDLATTRWDCLAKQDDGRWVSTSQIIKVSK